MESKEMHYAGQTAGAGVPTERGRPERQDLAELVRSIRRYLHYQKTMGLEWLPWQGIPTGQDLSETLAEVRADLGDCTRCRLHATRNHLVFGEGSERARVVLVGEGPGQEEDRHGRPFVGAAGKLLDRMIGAVGWRRHEVYICNVLKCRPPKNRDPEMDEIEKCGPFLRRQLNAIGPRAILALGSFAARFLLATQEPISRLRGQIYQVEGIPVIPTYHPAYLLRNPLKKREVWEDVQLVLALVHGNAEE
jgi:DNA polymerase